MGPSGAELDEAGVDGGVVVFEAAADDDEVAGQPEGVANDPGASGRERGDGEQYERGE